MNPIANARLLFTMALRNLFRHRGKTLIVGSIMFFGTMLIVLGNAMLDSIEGAMQRSITSSVAGHLQVYSKDAKDELALYGNMGMSRPDIGVIEDFAKTKEALLTHPNVADVVPMGTEITQVLTGNEFDRKLEELRAAIRASDTEAAATVAAHVRQLVDVIAEEFENASALIEASKEQAEAKVNLERAQSESFWGDFDREPLPALEFLENRIAPLGSDGHLIYLRILGTDLDLFSRSFESFELVRGEKVPEGRRGILINRRFHEDWLKNKVARGLDEIYEAVTVTGKSIAADPILLEKVKRNTRQYQRILFELDAVETKFVAEKLRAAMPGETSELPQLLQRFLEVSDETLASRYALFYDVIAPRIRLYHFDVGDVITLRAYTKAGYLKSANLKVYGTFTFKGVEQSKLAGVFNLVDLATFRELFGMPTAATRAEAAAIRERVGVEEVAREDAEAALFGEDDVVVTDATTTGFDEFAQGALEGVANTADWDRPLQPAELTSGYVLNAAVLLKDPSKLRATMAELTTLSEAQGLGLKVIDWQQAAGMIGQFILVIRLVLFVAVLITFIVALVIINNSMVMATMERVAEIGTMRAIGAHRRFIMLLFLLETIFLGLIAGALGALAGAGVVLWLGYQGISAGGVDVLVFLFGGPKLHPTVTLGHLVVAIFVILVVSLISTLYPARIATRIQPVEAMQARE